MRYYKKILNCFLVTLFLWTNSFAYFFPQNEKSLAAIYKSGSIRLIPVMVINEEPLSNSILFESIVNLDIGERGDLYVCDFGANNIKKFNQEGSYITTIGREGHGPGEFSGPRDIAATKDRLIVYDMGNRRFCALTPEGNFIKSVPVLMGEGNPMKIEALTNGNLAIGLERIRFADLGKPQDYIINLYSSNLEKIESVFSKQIQHYKYQVIDGRLSNIIQPFTPLIYWNVSPEGKIIIGDSSKYEIHIYDEKGVRKLSFCKSFKRIKITDQDKKEFFSNIFYSDGVNKKGVSDSYKKSTDFPEFKPAFKQILVDSEGNIIVFINREKKEEEWRYFDAFDSQGNFLATVYIEGDRSFSFQGKIKNRSFWLIETDEDGFHKIVKYQLVNNNN